MGISSLWGTSLARLGSGMACAALVAAVALPGSAAAQTTTNLVVNTTHLIDGVTAYPFPTTNVDGVALDAAPGYPSGSIRHNGGTGAAKSEIYFTPAILGFIGPVLLGDIASIDWWTKTGALHSIDPRDWYLVLYTNPFGGDVSVPGWYGERIGSEPYFSSGISDPAGTWNNWNTDGPTNKLRFFESTLGYFGGYGDPDWATFVAGNGLSGQPYAGHSVLYFSLQTGSGWAAGFLGQLDGFRVELTDGSVATVNFEANCNDDGDCEVDGLYCTVDTCTTSSGACYSVSRDCSTDVATSDFESPTYSLGNINGQDGWQKTGAYDVAVSGSLGTFGYGAQSLRISNAVTSGSFGDHTFSKPVVNEVGETTATSNGMSGGSRRTHFETQFDIASTVPGAQQPGLFFSTNADRGDGARMTWLGFSDTPTGLEIGFYDYQDFPPYGSIGTPADGCGAGGDNFIYTLLATGVDRSVPHTILETIDVVDGPLNDVVQVYIDNVLVHTGTTWEDYFRWCESTGVSRTIDSRLFRTAGTAAPATAGAGFLIDNFSIRSGDNEGDVCGDTCNEAADTCDTPSGTGCTDDFNPCTVDQCDGSGNCTHTPGNAGATCRAAAGPCDVAETCTGASATCPVDLKSTAVCRAAAGVCDLAETCNGVADTCPADVKSTAVCRASAGVCDLAETCNGVADTCPGDAKSTAVCRASAGVCDVAESCDGVNNACPVDAFLASSTPCRSSAGVCDTAENCTGSAAACPADAKSAAVCRASAGVCDVAESCDGVSNTCPADAFASSATTCRASAGVCDTADSCTGAAAACPADAKSTAVCRASAGVCDVAESCDGVGDACPANAFVPADTACTSDANACTDDVCDGAGACTHDVETACLELHPTVVHFRAEQDGNAHGAIRVNGFFVSGPPADTFDASSPISLTIEDALVTSVSHTWSASQCTEAASGAIRCASPDKLFKVIFMPVGDQVGVFRFRSRFKGLGIDGPFAAPIDVDLEHGSGPSNRVGEVLDCVITTFGLKCRQP